LVLEERKGVLSGWILRVLGLESKSGKVSRRTHRGLEEQFTGCVKFEVVVLEVCVAQIALGEVRLMHVSGAWRC
jgi:hypothetical protein